ncbi:unnamed protein product [Rotaria magnacalcarata]|uniref:G-protein coupled receptors family 1 profile domain-containing protein n=2 Tax=Rotaria magnacalcarata TaxID=392030 RepID=A0A815NSU2_9BILA|nr:unnamed protein product [Rotaria magnacalcarata]CAF1440818.1 unnamed protein product [Rotaria magnacalcarata]
MDLTNSTTMISTTNSSMNSLTIPLSHYFLDGLNFFFNHIYLLLLSIIGSIGNTLVIIIFSQRAFRTKIESFGSNMSIYPFLFYMAISDTLYLIILFCLWLSNYINVLHRSVICQLTLYITYVCNFINAYYTVAFTAQRLFAVINPFQVSRVLSWYRSRCLALSIILFACAIYSYLPFLIGIVNGKCFSRPEFRWINKYMDIIDSIIVFLIPYFAIITMNTIILISLRRMKHNQEVFLFRHHSQLNRIRELTRRNASRKITQLLLTVSTSYLIICAPYASIHTWRLLNSHQEENKNSQLIKKLEHYSLFIYHISFAMNFYIYILFGSKFRRELKRLFTKSKQNFYHYFQERKVYENENRLELTGKNSTMSVEYSFNGDLNQTDDGRRMNSNKFQGNGLSFKCKIIGMEEIQNQREEKLCLELMNSLKTIVRARGEHKQRIQLNLTMTAIKVFDEGTKTAIIDHEVTHISFVVMDPKDPRAFGYIYNTNDGRHQFWAMKTERPAVFTVLALKELFEIVFGRLKYPKNASEETDEIKSTSASPELSTEQMEQSSTSSISISTPQTTVIFAKPIKQPIQAPRMPSFNNIWGERTSQMISQAASALETPVFDDPWGERSSTKSASKSPLFDNDYDKSPAKVVTPTTLASTMPVFDDTWGNTSLATSASTTSTSQIHIFDDPWGDRSSTTTTTTTLPLVFKTPDTLSTSNMDPWNTKNP